MADDRELLFESLRKDFITITFNNLDRIQLIDKNSTTSRSFTPVKGVIEIA